MLDTKNNFLLQNPSSAALIALKPRQILLAEQQSKPKPDPTMTKKPDEINALQPEQKSLLLHSVIQYLHSNGFSKTLQRFLKEAQIKDDSWKSDALDLETMCLKYLSTSKDTDSAANACKEQEMQRDGTEEKASIVPEDVVSKKNKKKKKDKEKQPEVSAMVTEDKPEDGKSTSNSKARPKDKKKKKKLNNNSLVEDSKEVAFENQNKTQREKDTGDIQLENNKSETKEKKRKKEAKVAEGENFENRSLENGTDNLKESKKRKRLASVENVNQHMEDVAIEESKRQKTEDLKDQRREVINGEAQEASNGNISDNAENKSALKKQRNGSAEPKTVNAFQRVKVEEVKFVDARLKDNSYWAKDGAEVGYGAKAQEVLGQVKGRDFRHEKTKKKRGSYRGGQIDLHSHSIKFNYSDEE